MLVGKMYESGGEAASERRVFSNQKEMFAHLFGKSGRQLALGIAGNPGLRDPGGFSLSVSPLCLFLFMLAPQPLSLLI